MEHGSDKNLQDLYQAAATEQDPKRLMSLIAEIIKVLDDRNLESGFPILKRSECAGGSFTNLPIRYVENETCESGISRCL